MLQEDRVREEESERAGAHVGTRHIGRELGIPNKLAAKYVQRVECEVLLFLLMLLQNVSK
jgi:hypothetical protein